jgi:hypothetical protein
MNSPCLQERSGFVHVFKSMIMTRYDQMLVKNIADMMDEKYIRL